MPGVCVWHEKHVEATDIIILQLGEDDLRFIPSSHGYNIIMSDPLQLPVHAENVIMTCLLC